MLEVMMTTMMMMMMMEICKWFLDLVFSQIAWWTMYSSTATRWLKRGMSFGTLSMKWEMWLSWRVKTSKESRSNKKSYRPQCRKLERNIDQLELKINSIIFDWNQKVGILHNIKPMNLGGFRYLRRQLVSVRLM